jgi:GTP-binding protein
LIKVREVSFIKSASELSQSPDHGLNEIVILGRSNVGKSSTINSLTERKGLAKSSNTPGKTKLINFFRIDFKRDDEVKEFVLVDLPGIGYAKVSKAQKSDWEEKLVNFIQKREAIKIFLYLIDSRHTELQIDKDVISFLRTLGKDIMVVFTKSDKLKKSDLNKLKSREKGSVLISNLKKDGVETLREKIFEIV